MPIFLPRNGRIFWLRWFVFAAALLASAAISLHAQQPAATPPAPLPDLPSPMRGMTISSQGDGPALEQALDELKTLGVNTIALDSYAQLREDGHVVFPDQLEAEPFVRALDAARSRGLAVMLIPRLGNGGTRFNLSGEISFNTNDEWNRFFADYQRWIIATARVAQAHGVGLLCIGLGYTHAQMIEPRWRDIITAVRAVYGGKLTYGGNWDSYGQVGFYDALDYLGVLAYFPLTTKSDPSFKQIAHGWEQPLRNLRARSKQLSDKPVLFVQIGYNDSTRAASDPLNSKKGGLHAAEVQGRCVETALRLLERERAHGGWLAGMFWWQWPAPPAKPAEGFDLRQPQLKKLFNHYWHRPANTPPTAPTPATLVPDATPEPTAPPDASAQP